MTDEELIRFCSEFKRGLLGDRSSARMCYIMCAPLSSLLNVSGVPNDLCQSIFSSDDDVSVAEHFWLLLRDGRVLDPTLDQFNEFRHKRNPWPFVYLGKRTKYHKVE